MILRGSVRPMDDAVWRDRSAIVIQFWPHFGWPVVELSFGGIDAVGMSISAIRCMVFYLLFRNFLIQFDRRLFEFASK